MHLYRPMYEKDGKPEVGNQAHMLGLRLEDEQNGVEKGVGIIVYDIKQTDLNEDGHLEPDAKTGLSAFEPDPNDTVMPRFKKDVKRGRKSLWEIDSSKLETYGLQYVKKPDNEGAGLIIPLYTVDPKDFDKNIKTTVNEWRECNEKLK